MNKTVIFLAISSCHLICQIKTSRNFPPIRHSDLDEELTLTFTDQGKEKHSSTVNFSVSNTRTAKSLFAVISRVAPLQITEHGKFV